MTTDVPYVSWVADEGDGHGESAHAVAVTDGVPARLTLCGERVAGSVQGPFTTTGPRIRCRYCADVLGVSRT